MPKPWQWTEQEQAQAEKGHAEFFLERARAARDLYLQGNENVFKGLTQFDADLPNIRAGQAWAAANADKNQESARICSMYPDALAHMMQICIPLREQITWLGQAANAARRLQD